MSNQALPRRQIWTSQPQGLARPSELIKGAVACAPVVGLESVAKQSIVGTPTKLVTKDGISTTFASSQWLSIDHGYKSNAYTLIALCPLFGSVGESHLLDDDDVAGAHSGGLRAFQFRVVGFDCQFIAFNNEPSVIDVLSINLNPTLSKKFYVAVARAGGGKQALDISGCGGVSQTMLSHRNLSGNVWVGNFKGDSASMTNPEGVLAYAVLPYYASDSVVKKIIDSPWQIFKRSDSRLFAPVSAGGALNASASGSSQSTGTAALAEQVALAAVGISTASGSATATTNIPLAAAGIAISSGNATPAATITITAAGLAQAAGQAGLSASVLIAGAGAALAAGNATLAAKLNALANGAAIAAGSAVLSVSVNLVATGNAAATGSAAGTASAPGAISADGEALAGGEASWSVLATLTAAGFVQAMGAGAFTVEVPLSASGQVTAAGSANGLLLGEARNYRLAATAQRLTQASSNAQRLTTLHHEVRRA